jgi:MYXO-CTERM domain-containing protein
MSAATPNGYTTPASGLSSSGTGTATNGTPVALNSTATVLYYKNSSGTDSTVSMNWRTRTATEAKFQEPLQGGGLNGSGQVVGYLISDVVSLTGMVNNGSASGQTDPFVLQVSYTEALLGPDLTSAANHEAMGAPLGRIYLSWKDNSNTWVNAVAGNFGGSTTFAGATSWLSYYNTTSSVDDYSDIADFLGAYGVDPTNNFAWAVLNHNSEFAVIPEPSTLVLGGLALLGLAGAGLRRRRMAKQGA